MRPGPGGPGYVWTRGPWGRGRRRRVGRWLGTRGWRARSLWALVGRASRGGRPWVGGEEGGGAGSRAGGGASVGGGLGL